MQIIDEKEKLSETNRFKPYYITLSERIYGRNFQSPGGAVFLDRILDELPENGSGQVRNALDIGFGCGGNAIYLNGKFDCPVTAIDINDPFFDIAADRIKEAGADPVRLVKRSILEFREQETYDIILCRDVLMYIEDKQLALDNMYASLTPNGRLILIDYCRRSQPISPEFHQHVSNGQFELVSLEAYKGLFDNSPFRQFSIKDVTADYIAYMSKALDELDEDQGLHEAVDVEFIRERTRNKINYCREGSMVWGLIVAEKLD